MSGLTSSSQSKTGFSVKTTLAPSTSKAIVVTNPSLSAPDTNLLKKQLDESNKMMELFKEKLKRQELENARLKMLLEKN